MIVADTSPLNYLALIDAAVLLPRLYERVLIPPAVWMELTRPETPKRVRRWVEHRAIWLDVVTPRLPVSICPILARAKREPSRSPWNRAEVLLLDERDGTATAGALGLAVTGTPGVLDSARLGRADLPTMFARVH